MTCFVVNDERVNRFVTEMNGMTATGVHSSIGVERDGEIIGGVIYDSVNKTNACLHVASKPGVNWLSRSFLKMVFGFPFIGLGVKRLTAFVPDSNERAKKFDTHLGFEHEARLKGIYPDGDLLVMVMWKEKCRWI